MRWDPEVGGVEMVPDLAGDCEAAAAWLPDRFPLLVLAETRLLIPLASSCFGARRGEAGSAGSLFTPFLDFIPLQLSNS